MKWWVWREAWSSSSTFLSRQGCAWGAPYARVALHQSSLTYTLVNAISTVAQARSTGRCEGSIQGDDFGDCSDEINLRRDGWYPSLMARQQPPRAPQR